MRKAGSFGVMTIVALFFGGACGGSSSDGDSSGTTLEELPVELAEVLCGIFETCFATEDTDCVETVLRDLEEGGFALVERAVDAGEIAYDPSAVSDCLTAVSALGCDLFTTRLSDVCGEVLVGTVPAGGDCTLDEQCEGSLFCKTDADCPGTCAPLLTAGQTCEDSDQCQTGLACWDETEKCVEPAKEGQSCAGPAGPPCAPQFVCQGGDETTAGTCRALADVLTKADGSSCDFLSTDLCQSGLHCAVISASGQSLEMQCMEPASSGGACRLAIPEHCPEGEYCALEPGTVEGTCRDAPTDGQPCAVQIEDQGATVCAPEHLCVNGTCQAMQRLGGACQIGDTCYSGICVDGGCAPAHCADAG